jgi:hypothetical protein
MIAPVMVCVVLTGIPKPEEIASVAAALDSAARQSWRWNRPCRENLTEF